MLAKERSVVNFRQLAKIKRAMNDLVKNLGVKFVFVESDRLAVARYQP